MQEKVLQLLESKRYNELKEVLETINSADIAQILSEVKNEDMILLYRFLSKDTAVETFSYMETELQERLIHAMTDNELHDVMAELFLDDTVDLIEEMPANIVKDVYKRQPEEPEKEEEPEVVDGTKVDGISGATITTKAILVAINNAHDYLVNYVSE